MHFCHITSLGHFATAKSGCALICSENTDHLSLNLIGMNKARILTSGNQGQEMLIMTTVVIFFFFCVV